VNKLLSADGAKPKPSDAAPIGWVDGSTEATTRRFHLVLDENAVVQLDELVQIGQTLPTGELLRHYGIVVEGRGVIEGAEFPSDTKLIAHDATMPGSEVRRVEVQVLRTMPEMWLAPRPGAMAYRAIGEHRDNALFHDQMDQPLAVGLDQAHQPVNIDFSFLNGQKGGHASVSGISGVATKTTWLLHVLYMLFETDEGRRILGPSAPQTRAVVFNVKGEDLLHLDRPNAQFERHPDARRQWEQLGVSNPGPFKQVEVCVPRGKDSRPGTLVVDAGSRPQNELTVYGWSPQEFIRRGLLQFCFTDANDRSNQLSFIEQRVRVQLARWAWPMEGEEGAVVLAEPPTNTGFNLDRVINERRATKKPGEGYPVRAFADLVDFLTTILVPDDGSEPDRRWTGGVQGGTALAFYRRLTAQTQRIGHLVATGVSYPELRRAITVVDIHSLHDDAQRFVVGAILSKIFEDKQGRGREPLSFILLDELNKYCPREGSSPLKEMLVDIASRGRSLGVLLLGAQQSASDVDPAVIRNAAIKVAGRLDAGEAGEYRYLSPELRERATRFLPGTMVLDQPLVPAPIPIRFPFPGFATNVVEAAQDLGRKKATEDAFSKL
jgi:uncharacterized protein